MKDKKCIVQFGVSNVINGAFTNQWSLKTTINIQFDCVVSYNYRLKQVLMWQNECLFRKIRPITLIFLDLYCVGICVSVALRCWYAWVINCWYKRCVNWYKWHINCWYKCTISSLRQPKIKYQSLFEQNTHMWSIFANHLAFVC